MKAFTIVLLLLTFAWLPATAQPAPVAAFYDQVDTFLGTHVKDGRVAYEAIARNPAGLDALLTTIAGTDRTALTPDDDKAFLVNAYNILTIKTVVDHLPLASPLDLDGFFTGIDYTVAGQSLTLDQLEKETLYPAYTDARLHFVLVCAAVGCPALIPAAYRGDRLDDQLDRQTRAALNDPQHVRYDAASNTVHLSELFTWYEADFTHDHHSVIAFVNAYRTAPIPADAQQRAIPYDWALNGR